MTSSARQGRAIGAMFFAVFGCLWNLSWAWQSHSGNWILFLAIAVTGVTILTSSIRIYQHNSPTLQAETKASKSLGRYFHMINFGQWLVIFITVNVLINLGKQEWVTVSIIFIVGLHFIPLARLFRTIPHYVLGGVIMLWAVCYPWLASGGPADPIGCLGIGLLLWGGALYGLRSIVTASRH